MSRTTCTVCGSGNCCCGCNATAPSCSSTIPIPCSQVLPCSSCPEDHTKTIIQATYAASVRIQNTWNIPDCGDNTVITIPGLSQITVGAYLWNPTYGYFQVTAFNSTLQQVTIVNNCTDGNATPGTKVPACTDFNLSPPPCTCSNAQPDLFPYVALDFTAPNNGDCTNITVTTVNGLIAGKSVEIASGTYLLDSVVSGTVIKICNEGDGLPPGTPVIAQDGAGNYQYPVILVDANSCTNPAEEEGTIIVCNGDDLQVPLESAIPGSPTIIDGLIVAPALTDGSTTVAAYTPVDANLRLCTTLAAGVTITSGDPTYTLQLTDTDIGFAVGDILNIQGRTETFTVTGGTGSALDVTADPTPGANGTIPLGHWVCLQTCCDRVLAAPTGVVGTAEHTDSGNVIILSGSTTRTGTHVTFTIDNPDSVRELNVLVSIISQAPGIPAVADGDILRLTHQINYTVDGGGTQTSEQDSVMSPGTTLLGPTWGLRMTWTFPVTIAAGGSSALALWTTLIWIGVAPSYFTNSSLSTSVSYIGVFTA